MAVNKIQYNLSDKLYFRGADRIPYLKEREIRVSSIYCDSLSESLSPEEIAKDRDLSLESVNQAIDWCEKNKNLVSRILREERRKAGIKD